MKENLKLEAQVTKVQSEKKPDLRALASVQFGGFRINNIRIVEREFENGGEIKTRNVVLFPKHKRINKEGEMEYRDIITFGRDEEQGRKIRSVISNMLIKSLEEEGRTIKTSKETDFEIDKEFVSSYINPTTNSEKTLGVGTIYYGGLMAIRPVYLKEAINPETNERFNALNFETRIDKEGKYNEVIYPIQEGLRKKCVDEAMKSLKKNKEQMNEIEDLSFIEKQDSNTQENDEEDIEI